MCDSSKEAEREPVCPKGVMRGDMLDHQYGDPCRMGDAGKGWQIRVGSEGTVTLLPDTGGGWTTTEVSPALLEYAAALSRYRAAQHASKATERQRLLDVVRAAEDAYEAAHKAVEDTHKAYRDAEAAVGRTHSALKAARREAGL